MTPDRIREALTAFSDFDPLELDNDLGIEVCVICGSRGRLVGSGPVRYWTPIHATHTDDCLWVKANEVLGRTIDVSNSCPRCGQEMYPVDIGGGETIFGHDCSP